jgi:peroxiredoxin Q/BCP
MSKLSVGDKAPDFSSVNQHGEKVSLKDFDGNKLILYFYPKDNTPGCTKQACNLRDNYQSLQDDGYQLLGVSPDDEKSHQKFIDKFDLPFDLVVDAEHGVSEAYGVWVEKNMYGRKFMGIARTTFLLDENGIISEIISKVKTDNHTDQILK